MIVYVISRKCEWPFESSLKGPQLAQLDKWFTAMHSIGKPLTGPMITEKAKLVYDEM
jgi:hypothetical protein